jgi:hypothetical protein
MYSNLKNITVGRLCQNNNRKPSWKIGLAAGYYVTVATSGDTLESANFLPAVQNVDRQ